MDTNKLEMVMFEEMRDLKANLSLVNKWKLQLLEEVLAKAWDISDPQNTSRSFEDYLKKEVYF